MTGAAFEYTMVEQFLPTALKAVAIALLAGAAAVCAYLGWAAMRDHSRSGDDG